MTKLEANRGWITPSPMADKEGVQKQAHLSSPFSRHTINNMRSVSREDIVEEVDFDDNAIEGTATALTMDFNLLIPQLSFLKFGSQNFNYKHCKTPFRDQPVLIDKIGFASNVFWKCPNTACTGAASILAVTCQTEASGKF
jgi:hypothetical protein